MEDHDGHKDDGPVVPGIYDPDPQIETSNAGKEPLTERAIFEGAGYGMMNWDKYALTEKSFMFQTTQCCFRRHRQLEMNMVTDVAMSQTCCQKRKGAGVLRFYTVDPLMQGESITATITNVKERFQDVVKILVKNRRNFSKKARAGDDYAIPDPKKIYKGEGYYCCPCHCCNLCCPVNYKITTEDLLEEKICCCCCHTSVNFLSIRRVFQVDLSQNCWQYMWCCCPDAGDLTLWTTDDSAGNMFNIRLPHKAVAVFQRIRRRVNLEEAMLERIKMRRMVGMAMDILDSPTDV